MVDKEAEAAFIALVAGGFHSCCNWCGWKIDSQDVIDVDSTSSSIQAWLAVECPHCRRVTLRRHVY